MRPDGSPELGTLRRLLGILDELRARGAESKPLLGGEEIMAVTGMAPGPDVGRVLDALREAQLRGEVADVEHARMLIRAMHVAD
jgi:hypothetical protein